MSWSELSRWTAGAGEHIVAVHVVLVVVVADAAADAVNAVVVVAAAAAAVVAAAAVELVVAKCSATRSVDLQALCEILTNDQEPVAGEQQQPRPPRGVQTHRAQPPRRRRDVHLVWHRKKEKYMKENASNKTHSKRK